MFKVVVDIRYFLVILMLIVIGFGLAFNVVIRDTSTEFSNIAIALFSQYRMIFGE